MSNKLQQINGKILVTGAGGSVGSEIVEQLAKSTGNAELYCIDANENSLFRLQKSLSECSKKITFLPANLCEKLWKNHLAETNFEIVIHAAAYKHVPLSEVNPFLYFHNNVKSTMNVIDFAKTNAKKITLISTDKAVWPINIMGFTKRICELLIFDENFKNGQVIRFGNVINSSGSVLPIFKEQIAEGGPVTVTSKEAWRYFMSIQQAVELVIDTAFSKIDSRVVVLDMGSEVNIDALARNFIEDAGLRAVAFGQKLRRDDIEIKYIGLRDGEKARESLYYSEPKMRESLMTWDSETKPTQEFVAYIKKCLKDLTVPKFEKIDWENGCLK